MITNIDELREALTGPADRSLGLGTVRRRNELKRLLEVHARGECTQILRLEGETPTDITGCDLLLNSPHLVNTQFPRWLPGPEVLQQFLLGDFDAEALQVESLLPVRVSFPRTHPDRLSPPALFLLDHRVWHPSVAGPAICWAEKWDPTRFLVDVLDEVAALLRFEGDCDLGSPLNPQAAAWVAAGCSGFDVPLSTWRTPNA